MRSPSATARVKPETPRQLTVVPTVIGLGLQAASRRSYWPLTVGLVLLVIFVVSACGSSQRAAAATSAARATSSSGSESSGCGRIAPTGSSTLRLTIDGHRRLVIVHIPTRYRAGTPVSLVLNLHGSESTAGQQELFSGMDTTADQDGFIVAYPQALIRAGSGFDWNVPGEPLLGGTYPPRDAADDVAFLSDLVGDMATRYCIDLRRVYATGVSGGGRMASQLACDAARIFAAVAPVAGLRFPSPCPGTRKVAVIAFHGTADPIDPYNGNGQAYWTYSVPTAARRWAVHDGCSRVPNTTSAAGYTLTAYDGCAKGAGVELYSVTGEGHEWPGGPSLPHSITRVLGPQSDAINANTTMWAFFLAHPLP